MRPIEEERWDRVDREVPTDHRTDSPTDSPTNPPVRPAEPVREEHYSRSTVVPGSVASGYDPRVERVIWFIVALVGTLIAIRFFMKLLGASYQADFVRFMYGITAPLVAPFHGIFQTSGSGTYVLEPESLVAIAIYLLIGWAVVALIRIMRAPRTRPVV
jgi:YggT family protein